MENVSLGDIEELIGLSDSFLEHMEHIHRDPEIIKPAKTFKITILQMLLVRIERLLLHSKKKEFYLLVL